MTSFIIHWLRWERHSLISPTYTCHVARNETSRTHELQGSVGHSPSLSKHYCLVPRDRRQGKCPMVETSLCSGQEAHEKSSRAQVIQRLESQRHQRNPPDRFDCVSGFYPLGYFQRRHQTEPLPRVSAPLLLERAAVGPHPL